MQHLCYMFVIYTWILCVTDVAMYHCMQCWVNVALSVFMPEDP